MRSCCGRRPYPPFNWTSNRIARAPCSASRAEGNMTLLRLPERVRLSGTSTCHRPDGTPPRTCGRAVSAPTLNALGMTGTTHFTGQGSRIKCGDRDASVRTPFRGDVNRRTRNRQTGDIDQHVRAEIKQPFPWSLSRLQQCARDAPDSVLIASKYPRHVSKR